MAAVDWALLALLSVLWGGSFLFNKVAVSEIPPFTVALGRVAIGAALLALACRVMRTPLPCQPRVWGALFVMGLFNSVLPFSLMLWGQRQITAGLASILIATTPLFGVVVAHFATADDRITRAKAVGLTLGFAGVTLMLGPDLLSELGHDVLAQGALLAAAIAYALSGVFARRFRSLPVTSAAAGQMIAATIMLLPLALLDRPWTLAAPSPAAWAAIAGLGALSTALAYLLFFKVLARAGATNIMLVNFLIPVTGILLGVSILGERLEPRQLAGMAIIGLGLAAIDGRAARWAFQRRAALN